MSVRRELDVKVFDVVLFIDRHRKRPKLRRGAIVKVYCLDPEVMLVRVRKSPSYPEDVLTADIHSVIGRMVIEWL